MNINMLMQQAQRMQKDMESNIKKAKEELAQTEVHAEAGGGLVKVTMTARFVVKRIEINPELLQDVPTLAAGPGLLSRGKAPDPGEDLLQI